MVTLPKESQQVLSVVLDTGTIRGFELRKRSSLQPTEFLTALRPLIDGHLIAASGVCTAETIERVQFAPLSAAYEKSSYLLS
jgi:hypothetical protein